MRVYNANNAEAHSAREKARRNGPKREEILAAKRAQSKAAHEANPNYRSAYFNDPAIKARKAEYDRKRRAEKGVKLALQQKQWRTEKREYLNAYCRNKRRTDPQYAIRNNLRCRMNIALRLAGLKRDAPLENLIGCTIAELIAHLEKQFAPGMTWANRGHTGKVWHVDHKKPCAAFDLTDSAQRAECFHFTNLQPLWSVENIRKGARAA